LRYTAVLLDFYGTLVEEDHPHILRIVEQVAAASPLGGSPSQVARAWSAKYERMCAEFHGAGFVPQRAIELDSLRLLLREWRADLDAEALSAPVFEYWRAPRPFPETEAFLRRLPAQACVVSNIDSADVRAAIDWLGWDLPLVVTSESARAYKPRREPFEAALRLLGGCAGQALHVGDSADADVAGAQAMGMDVAWVNRRGRPLPSAPPTHVCASLDDVLRHLSQ
jgi:2-haloacid dehalogenase/putative hydrolase of the HAD superfamily